MESVSCSSRLIPRRATRTLRGEQYPSFVYAMPMLRVIKTFLMNPVIFTIDRDDPNFLLEQDDDVKNFKATYHQEIFYDDVVRKMKCVRETLLNQFKDRFCGLSGGR